MLTPVKQTENQATKPTASNGSFFGGGGGAPFFQAKLTVNQPGDEHEREADAVADQVMRMKAGEPPIIQRMPIMPVSSIQRACAACEHEKEKEGVQRKENGGGDASVKAAPSIVSDVLSSGKGQSMDDGTKQFMETRFGQDFSQVRVHTDSRAAESASAIQARAYTSGRDVVFGAGEYQPESEGGKQLLAHELVHIIQQGGERGSRSNVISRWTSLGTWSWNDYNGPRVVDFRVGNESEWKNRLSNVDDADEFVEWLYPFLYSVLNENVLTTKVHPDGFSNFKNALKRRPNNSEISTMINAMYALKDKLDLPIGGIWEMSSAQGAQSFQILMSDFLRKYQSFVLWSNTEKGEPITEDSISNVVEQSGHLAAAAMIENAGATALKGVDILAMSRMEQNATKRDLTTYKANELISNSGRTIRYALKANVSVIAFNQSVSLGIFNLIWGMLPGGGALTEIGKDILKDCFVEIIKTASGNEKPDKKAKDIFNNFILHVNKLFYAGNISKQDAIDAKQSFAINDKS